MSKGPSVRDREIVVAVVSPVGAPVNATLDALRDAFKAHRFDVKDVRISELLDTAVPDEVADISASTLRKMMDKGDAFRSRLDDDSACAYMAAQAIARARTEATGQATEHRSTHVNLVRSLKTEGEVRTLRSIYGQRLIVVGVSASKEERRAELTRQLVLELDKSKVDIEASYLLRRDEEDEEKVFGQRTSKAYRLSDAYVAVKTAQEAKIVDRLVELLLGEPFKTPSRDEQGMFQAWATMFRSSAAGRQVGAAIVDDDGEVVTLGCNDVPKPGGGQYWADDPDDRRDFQLGHDANDKGKFGVAIDLLRELAKSGWLNDARAKQDPATRVKEALGSDGPLARSEVSDLIEYGRIVHAEMAALMTAARQGRSVRGCTLYTTTYPCHECFRLIIAAGVKRVCFIDPYSKSRAPELYEDMLDTTEEEGRVVVEPFVGVSPRLFARVFRMSNRRKDVQGAYAKWSSDQKKLILEDEEMTDSIPDQESAAGAYLKTRLAETSWTPESVTPNIEHMF